MGTFRRISSMLQYSCLLTLYYSLIYPYLITVGKHFSHILYLMCTNILLAQQLSPSHVSHISWNVMCWLYLIIKLFKYVPIFSKQSTLYRLTRIFFLKFSDFEFLVKLAITASSAGYFLCLNRETSISND